MVSSPFARLRHRLALAGGRAASAPAEAAQGRRDEARIVPARLIETPLRHLAIGAPVAWQEDVAFLDGTQHVELVGYVGTDPVIAAVIQAAVRLRHDRRMQHAASAERWIVIGREAALQALGGALDQHEIVPLDEEPPHPIRDLERANAIVDKARAKLEIEVAASFRATAVDCWLVIDGSLAASPDWANDPRMLGVVKSHASLPFEGPELETYLTLPPGHRSSIFQPESRRVTPLYAWGLRLHDFAGRDLFYGLVRIEASATVATLAMADTISRHLMAERAPLADDRRADRLLYGIHDVERYLRARRA